MEKPDALVAELTRDIPSAGEVYGPLLQRCADALAGLASANANLLAQLSDDDQSVGDLMDVAIAGGKVADVVSVALQAGGAVDADKAHAALAGWREASAAASAHAAARSQGK